MTDNTQGLDEILQDYGLTMYRFVEMYNPSAEWDAQKYKAKQAILDWHNKQVKDPFDYIQPCEPDCSPERHAYHQGQWDMAHRMIDKELTLKEHKEK